MGVFYDGRTDKEFERDQERFRRELQRSTLKAFGVKPWEAGLCATPYRVRIWRRLTFARWRVRRGIGREEAGQ